MRARRVVVPWFNLVTIRNGCCDKNMVAPDDGCRMSLAWQRNLPADVFALTPFYRRVGSRRYADAQWTTPLRPVVFGLGRAAIISHRAQGGAALSKLRGAAEFGESEIENLRDSVICYHDIGGFDVAVNDTFFVGFG